VAAGSGAREGGHAERREAEELEVAERARVRRLRLPGAAAAARRACAAVSPSEAYSAHACPASAERTACGVPEARRMGPR